MSLRATIVLPGRVSRMQMQMHLRIANWRWGHQIRDLVQNRTPVWLISITVSLLHPRPSLNRGSPTRQ